MAKRKRAVEGSKVEYFDAYGRLFDAELQKRIGWVYVWTSNTKTAKLPVYEAKRTKLWLCPDPNTNCFKEVHKLDG
jgi:hypothetical protein